MAQRVRLRLAAYGVLVGLIVAAPAAMGAPGGSAELIVGFRDGVTRAEQARVLSPWAGKVRKRWSRIDGVLASVPAGKVKAAVRALERDQRVAYAEPNHVLRALGDPGLNELWGLQAIDAPEAWQVTTGSNDVVVGVIDSGVDFSHPDLAEAMWTNPGESCTGCGTNGVDDDANGYVDDWRGWDFANGDNDPFDDNGHGTHVAGTVGAVGDNGIGISGVSKHVRVMGLKFIGANGSGTAADAVSAILYASANGAHVTNNSYGGDGFSQAMLDAIRTADSRGSLFVAAAGNSSSDNDAEPVYPAGYDEPNVLTVAATDVYDHLAWFSNYGAGEVDLAAPGVNVLSTWAGAGYRYDSGTSMAAPHAAGAAALAKAAFPSASDVGLKALLLRTVDRVPGLEGVVRTAGRLNVSSAVRCTGSPRAWVDAPAPEFEVDVGEQFELRVLATPCGSGAPVVLVNGSPVELTSRGDGLFTGSFTPVSAGALTVSADSHSVTGRAVQSYQLVPGGAPVTVTTSSPGENTTLRFHGVAGRRVALKVSGVTIGSSPCCSALLSVPGLVQPTPFGHSGTFVDTKTLPASGSYSVVVDPQGTAVGSATFTLYDVPPDATAPISPGGAPVSVTTGPVPGQNAVLSFHGLAGQRVSLKLSGVTMTSVCCAGNVSIPGVFPGALFGRNGLFVDTKVLPADGEYRVVVDPLGMETGSATVTLYDVPPDASVPLSGPTMVSAGSVPGQNAVARFLGTAGQRVLVRASNVTVGTSTCCSLKLSIPGATALPVLMGRNGGLIDTVRLPSTGAYSVLVDPQGMDAGSVTLTLFDVPPDVTGSITPGGAPVSVSTSAPGQNAALTFAGVAGQRVSLKLSGVTMGSSTCCSSKVGILKPDGSSLLLGTLFGTSGGFVDTKVLPVSGTYTVVLDPQGMDAGSATATLYDVPPDVTGSLAVGGPGVNVSLGTPGQNAVLTFSGTVGQRVTVRASSVTVGTSTCCSFVLSLKRPDGVTVASTLFGTNGGALSATISLAGTYTVIVDPQSANTGGATVTAA